MTDWWLIDEFFFMIDWWLIDDWLMINGMALSQFWLCPVILDCTTGLSILLKEFGTDCLGLVNVIYSARGDDSLAWTHFKSSNYKCANVIKLSMFLQHFKIKEMLNI